MTIILQKEDLEKTKKFLKVLGIEEQVEMGWVSDETKTDDGLNFKINYAGSSVPVWIKGVYEKEDLNNALTAISAGLSLGLNIVEISDKLKNN